MTTPKVMLRNWKYEVIFASYMIIRAVVRSFYPVFTLFFTFPKTASLANAEVLKDIAKYLIGSDFSCDVAEVIDAFAEILADEVA